MRAFDREAAARWIAVAAIAIAPSCASLGPRRAAAPCDERFDALLAPVKAGDGIEVVGKIRVELPRYRIRGIARIAYSPGEGAARIDFRHSSLFGAVEEDVTLLVGDSLVIYGGESGSYIGNDSSLALVRQETGCEIVPDDILAALLFAPPRCTGMESAAAERGGAEWRLQALWRGRRIEMRGEDERGIAEFKQCFDGDAGCYTMTYGEPAVAAGLSYPRWIRLKREGGPERISFELVDIKALTVMAGMLETDEALER